MSKNFLTKVRNQPAVEGINFQANTYLFDAITDAFEELRKVKNLDTKGIQSAGISEAVKAHTNMTIRADIKELYEHNAYLETPLINVNHPFLRYFVSDGLEHREGVQLMDAFGKKMVGGVDLNRGRVTGVYADISMTIVMGLAFIQDKRFSPREIAAIFLHELGHAFTYLELMRNTVVSSMVIGCASKAVYDIEDPRVREDVLVKAVDLLGIDLEDPGKLANSVKSQRAETVQTILISAYVARLRSETGKEFYEYRSVEQIADQFATRMGAGVELVTALDKKYRIYGRPQARSTVLHVIMEIVKVLMFIVSVYTFRIFAVIGLIVRLMTPASNIGSNYDDPKSRIEFVRHQLNDALKNKDLTPEMKKELLDDIKVIAAVEKGYKENRTLVDFLQNTFGSFSRYAYNQEKAQKELEKLLTNNLFAKAAEFDTMD